MHSVLETLSRSIPHHPHGVWFFRQQTRQSILHQRLLPMLGLPSGPYLGRSVSLVVKPSVTSSLQSQQAPLHQSSPGDLLTLPPVCQSSTLALMKPINFTPTCISVPKLPLYLHIHTLFGFPTEALRVVLSNPSAFPSRTSIKISVRSGPHNGLAPLPPLQLNFI